MRLIITCVVLAGALSAQTKMPVAPKGYGQFETLVSPAPDGGLSLDGKWLAYGINRSNRNNELQIAAIADATTKVVAFISQARTRLGWEPLRQLHDEVVEADCSAGHQRRMVLRIPFG